MVKPAHWTRTQVLRPRARILRTFGDELTSSETVAVIELVKNAYDADATRVLVRFQGPLEIGQGRIEVMDNGQGMSLETMQTTWMDQPHCSGSVNSAVNHVIGRGRSAVDGLSSCREYVLVEPSRRCGGKARHLQAVR